MPLQVLVRKCKKYNFVRAYFDRAVEEIRAAKFNDQAIVLPGANAQIVFFRERISDGVVVTASGKGAKMLGCCSYA
jgi:hypothetical protein